MWFTIKHVISLLAVLLLVSFNFSIADESEEEALLELYGGEELVSIATGTAQPISKAPAVATVITAADIKQIGARDIDEALETVPGLHVSRSTLGGNSIYSFRGIYDTNNPQVLMLINGISISNLFTGNRGQVWGGMPVEAISRIEVIRGPGSAVYGADAFAGVINIVTKNANEIDGTQTGIRYGSFNTKEAWLLHGGSYAGFDIAFMGEIKSTDGHHENVHSDFQNFSDSLFPTPPFPDASLAPGSTNNNRDNIDLRLDVRKDNFTFRGGLQRRRNLETGFGVGAALDPNAEYESDRWNADLTYHNPEFTEDWDVQLQTSFFNTSQEVDEDTLVFPPGSFLLNPDMTFSGPYPDGVIGNPEVWERHWRVNFTALYSGF